MKALLKSEAILFLILLSPFLLLWASLLGRLYPIHSTEQIPFFFDLLEIHISLESFTVYIFGLISFLLIWLISKKTFNKTFWLMPLLFSISPWFAYLTYFGSYYIYLLALLLFTIYGLILIKSGSTRSGTFVFAAGSLMLLYSSLTLAIIYPLFIVGLLKSDYISLGSIKKSLFIIFLLCLPLLLFAFKNQEGTKNIFNNEINLFSDPGLISSVNILQGESRKGNLGFFSRLTENKYIYLSKYSILKAFKHLAPSTYFTPQQKLLNFSFSSPFFAGLLIPFLYGLFLIFKSVSLRRYLIWLIILMIPSFLAKSLVDLNRLIIFSPVMLFIIAFGLRELAEHKGKIVKIGLVLVILFTSLQFLNTLFDINTREYARYERSFDGIFEIKDS